MLWIHLTFVAEEVASLEKTFSVFVSPAQGNMNPILHYFFIPHVFCSERLLYNV